MLANFSTISKSINANEMLSLLRDTIGDELFNLISEFYYKNIIGIENSKSYKRVNK